MYKHLLSLLSPKNLGIAASAAACILGSFLIGIRSAGEILPLSGALVQASAFDVSAADAASHDVNGILVLILWLLRSLIL